jgi:hypothetical protein
LRKIKLVKESGSRPRRDNKLLRQVTIPCMELYTLTYRSKTKGKDKGISGGKILDQGSLNFRVSAHIAR